MTREEETALVKKYCDQLMEHFDSVQIFVTRSATDLDGTVHVQQGQGNFFARYGHVSSWLIKENESLREDVRSESK